MDQQNKEQLSNINNDLKLKITVLEANFKSYEEFSNKIIQKLESAIDKISTNISNSNNMITNMLAKHDQKLESNSESFNDVRLKYTELRSDFLFDINAIKTNLTNSNKEFDARIANLREHVDQTNNLLEDRINHNNEKISTSSGKNSIIQIIVTIVITSIITFGFTSLRDEINDAETSSNYPRKENIRNI